MTDEKAYFLTRAEAQFALARQAAHDRAAQAHYALAGYYWDRAFNPAGARAEGEASDAEGSPFLSLFSQLRSS